MKKVISLLALILIGSFLFAQTPATINYQAVARDTAGRILGNRSVTVRMTVYQGSPTGTSVYTENHSLSTNKFGLLNLELGSVNQSNFAAIDWGKNRHYLGVEINWGSGFVEMSRTELVSVPYALFSKETAKLRGFNVDTTQGTKGQVLKYDGSRWRAGWDSLPQYTAGGGILISGNKIIAVDSSDSNELQDLQLVGNILKITKNGVATNIDLSKYLDNKDTQQLTIKNDTIFLQRGGFVKMPFDKVNDADSVVGNEIQNVGTGFGAITRSGTGTTANPYKIDFIQGILNNQILLWDSINKLWKLGVITATGVFTETDGVIGNEVTDVGNGNGILSRSGSGTTAQPYKMDVASGTVSGQVWRWNGSSWAASMPGDTSATNEIQTLSISNDTIKLSGGGFA